MQERDSEAFNAAVQKEWPALHDYTKITVHNCALKYVPEELRFDAVVSPANSYARLDGAFDDALARAYGPPGDYGWITHKAQKVVYEKWRGFAPPGTCTLVRLDHNEAHDSGQPDVRTEPKNPWGIGSLLKPDHDETAQPSQPKQIDKPMNPWGTEYLLLCPTMRIPWQVKWDREVVYECIWSMLCTIDEHHRRIQRQKQDDEPVPDNEEREIKSVLMTPLATGVGQLSPERWARQCVLAMKHFVEAREYPQVWGNLQWDKIFDDHEEVVNTYRNDVKAGALGLGGFSSAK